MSSATDRNYPTRARRTKVMRQPRLAAAVPEDRRNVRVLDPATAVRLPGQPPPQQTSYLGDALLIRPTGQDDATIAALTEAAAQHQLEVRVQASDEELVQLAERLGIAPDQAQPLLSRVTLVPMADAAAAPPPDAWQVLQTFRAAQRDDPATARQVHLDHVLLATSWISGVPLTSGHGIGGVPLTSGHDVGGVPLTSGHAVPTEAGEFAIPGRGGRSPVAWIGPAPHRLADELLDDRRPVVAILDTGVGNHPWLGPDIVDRQPTLNGSPIGLVDPATDPETPDGDGNPLVGTLNPDSGHGTFIAGLIRQTCPDANLVAIRIMHGDGLVSEGDLIDALNRLWLRQLQASQQNQQDQLVDVVNLSLGYYHEDPADAAFDPLLLTPLRALSELGVAVVASAGNDATLRPMYPAAFAPYPGGAVSELLPGTVPLTAVGALNPGGTVALFSNEGPWVSCRRPGSALVSTMPVDFDAAGQPTVLTTFEDEVRETLDPDDFRSGFAIWSGTSFSAPILAGELAQALLDGGAELADCAPAAAVGRTLAALAQVTGQPAPAAAAARDTVPVRAASSPAPRGKAAGADRAAAERAPAGVSGSTGR